MHDQPLPATASATPDGVATRFDDTTPSVPATRVLVVERRLRGQEPAGRSTTGRIRAFQPQASVSVAYSGWEALEILRRGPARFDLVVIDANVGWMDPVDFVRRAQTVDPVLPAIITSASGYGAVLVPPESDAEAGRLLPRQLLRAVLRELRNAPVADPVHDRSFGLSAGPNAAPILA